MCEAERGLLGQIYKALENVRRLEPMVIHCTQITHQELICGKYLNLSCVIELELPTANFLCCYF